MALLVKYQLLPTAQSTGRSKRGLDVLVADQYLSTNDVECLAHIQLLNWYFDELGERDLSVVLHVPRHAVNTISVLDDLAVDYNLIGAFDEGDIDVVGSVAATYDCDVVLSAHENALHPAVIDDAALVANTVGGVLREAELHAKGFNAPWSFEDPIKHQPWMQFYAMSEHSSFRSILEEWTESKKASDATAEAMRVLVLSMQSICFSRDRMAFYRQQDRWAHRAQLERQDFRFEYTAYLNHFYFSLYSAVDQVAKLVVRAYNLEVADKDIGALYAAYRHAIKEHAPEIQAIWESDVFWKMYRLLRDMRHTTAHRGPLVPEVVYTHDGEFTTEQLDAKALELGYFDDARFFSGEMHNYVIEMARFKAKLALMGPPLKHCVFIQHENGAGTFYNPDPHADFQRFLAFLHDVIEAIKPWNRRRGPQAASS